MVDKFLPDTLNVGLWANSVLDSYFWRIFNNRRQTYTGSQQQCCGLFYFHILNLYVVSDRKGELN